MSIESNLYTRRKSSRFNTFLDAQIKYIEHRNEKKIESNIIDISQDGFKLVTKNRLRVNQEIQVEYTSLISKEKLSLSGKVKWVTNKNTNFFIGLELDNKENNITHLESINSYFQRYKSPMRHLTINHKHSNYFHYDFFCGLMFDTLSKYVEEKIMHLSTDINISKAYFEIILDRMKRNELTNQDIDIFSSSLAKLIHIQNEFSDIVNLFQNMNKEKHSKNLATIENQSCIINISYLLEERIKTFTEKIKCLSLYDNISLTWECGETNVKYVYSWRLSYGLDFILLYAYLSAITLNAGFIQLSLEEIDNTIYLNIVNNGSGLFLHDKQEILLKNNSDVIYNLSHWENRHIAILDYILSFFNDLSPEILIKSSLGHNLLSLRLYN